MDKGRMLSLVDVRICINYVQAKLQSDVCQWITSGIQGTNATYASMT